MVDGINGLQKQRLEMTFLSCVSNFRGPNLSNPNELDRLTFDSVFSI